MFLPNDMFRVSRELGSFVATIRCEIARVPETEFVDWPDRGAYSQGWRVFPLLLADPPPGFRPDLERNRGRCPRTVEVVQRFPEILTAGVSRLLPGCHIFPHRDQVRANVYRCHLGLHVRGPAGLRAGREEAPSGEGRVWVFDHRQEHEAANLGSGPRDVLLVDFVAAPAERQALERWLASGAGAEG